MRIIAAALFYMLIVYAAGFALGTMRVLLVEPRVGEIVATLCEAPFLLSVMVLAARRVPPMLSLPKKAGPLAAVGVGALLLQQFTDLAFAALVRGIAPAEQIAHFTTVPGLIYLALLVAFAAMPVLANAPRGRSP